MGKMRARSRSALMSITQSIMRQTRWELSIIPTTSNGWKRQGWIWLSYKQMEEMEIISPVLSVSCEYHSMVHFDDTVVIETKITKYNGIKMDVEYRMTDKETGELRTTAKSSHCFLNRSGRPISLKRSYPEIDTKFFEFADEN
jgi:acyl-CoA thioester hydrolase